MDEKLLTIDQIKAAYPDQWVLLGNPQLLGSQTLDSTINKLEAGIVLLSSKDRKEIGYKAREARKGYSNTAFIYTGEIPNNRKF